MIRGMTAKCMASVLILTYNHAKYVEDTLKGVLDQTYSDLEIIILDDASQDDTCRIIDAYVPELKKKFPRVVFMKHDKNTGNIPQNMNELISEAGGNYILGLSGDDIPLPGFAEVLVGQLDKHPDAAVVHANGYVEYEEYKYGDHLDWELRFDRLSGYEREDFFRIMMYGPQILAPAAAYRRNLHEKYGLYDINVGYEDYDFWLTLASAGERFFYYDCPVVIYRRCLNSISDRDQGDVESKLLFCISAEINSKKKHIDKLSSVDQQRIWADTYEYLRSECIRIGSEKCMDKLNEAFPEGELTDVVKPYSYAPVNVNKVIHESASMSRWVEKKEAISKFIKGCMQGRKSIAIFGYSKMGVRFHREVEDNGASISYIIDRLGDRLYAHLPVYTIDDDLPEVDVIVVTAMGVFDSVLKMLKKRSNAKIYDLEELIWQ